MSTAGDNKLSAEECRKKLKPFVLSPRKIQFNSKEEKGCGAYGTVFEVTVGGVPCVAKRVHETLVDRLRVSSQERNSVTEQFLRECVLLSGLDHPNVVRFVGVHYGRSPHDVSLVMERMSTDLGKYVEDTPNVPLSTKLSILYDVSNGLLYLHDMNILHRDLTANNVLLTENLQAKIADLGVSKLISVQQHIALAQTQAPGSLNYMPPEALKENPKYDQKIDIFSFGHLAIYVVIQEFPNVYEVTITPTVLSQGIHQRLRRQKSLNKVGEDHCLYTLIVRCLSDAPEKRPLTEDVNVQMKLQLALQKSKEESEKEQYVQDFEHLQEVEERNSSASHEVKKELDRLREESHQKDLLLQKAAEENLALHQLKEQLATAERNCQEQLEYIEQLNNKKLAIEDELQQKTDEFQKELQAKTAQVKQYKKQVDALQEKKEKEKASHEAEEPIPFPRKEQYVQDFEHLQEVEESNSSASHEVKKELDRLREESHQKDLLFQKAAEENLALLLKLAKNESTLEETKKQLTKRTLEMEVHFKKKLDEKDHELQHALKQKFDANKVFRAKCAELQNQLDSALDTVDGLKQQQEVLKQTLLDNGLQLPFQEPKPQYVASSVTETPPNQQGVVQHPPVAISHKPIASPGVYNQHVDERSYMPPHSNAELKYQEQQAQRQMNLQQQISGRGATNVNALNPTQTPPVIPHAQQHHKTSASAHENEAAVVGIPASAIGKLIPVPRSHNPRNTSRVRAPVQSRNSAGEMGPLQQSYPEQAGGIRNGHQAQLHPPSVECSSHAPYNQVCQQIEPLLIPNPQKMEYYQQPWQVPVSRHDMHVGGNVLPKAQDIGASGDAGSSQLQMHHLNKNFPDKVAEVDENKRVGDTRQIDSGLQSIPQDPNLQCVVCGYIFKIGQIQTFKRHVKTCGGDD